jgi:TatD DNase family protein
VRWFDSHCHLHICEEEQPVEEVIERAREVGVSDVLAVGIDVASSERAAELASADGILSSAGVHPNSADGWTPAAADRIEELLARPEVRAVGETGLDFYRDYVPPEVQRRAFRDHVEMSKSYDKALVIHTRDSVDAVLDELDLVGAPARVVFHCWSGSDEAMDRALALGAFVSFAGNVSFKSAQDLRDSAARVPLDRLLVETDSPYLAPVPNRGKPNEPAYVRFVGEAVAAAREVEVEQIATVTHENARTLFLP